VIGLLQVATVVAIAVGEGLPNPLNQPPGVALGFLALAAVVLGNLAGWRWPFLGGALSLAGSLAFIAFAAGLPPRSPNAFIWGLAIPGALYLAGRTLASRRSPTAGA
jgi:hypothetical protein